MVQSTLLFDVVIQSAMYDEGEVVYPQNPARNIFTVAAVDTIDLNPSSATASDSFHGTGIF